MKQLPRPAQVYILLIFGLGLAAVFASLYATSLGPTSVLIILSLAVIIAAFDLYPVRAFKNQANSSVEMTISVAVRMAAILLLPAPIVIISMSLGTLLAEVWLRRPGYKLIFNVGMMTVQCTVVAVLYNVLRDPNAPLLGSVQNLFALSTLGVSEFVLNSLLVSLVVALATGSSLDFVWVQNFRQFTLHELSMLPIGVFIYILWQFTPWSVVLAALPLLVMRYSYQLVSELRRQTREALYALARVLDERDSHTSDHSDMVAENAGLIARQWGLGPEEVELIMLAAAMHDIGKIGMRNDILFKEGPLTIQEREAAKQHAAIGGELVGKFPLFKRGASYVRHHHERWDGAGYPDGLKGEEIPIGARIIAVADSYQAMIEERPYRAPLGEEAAFQELRRCAGSQFDPDVVATFLRAKGVDVALEAAPVSYPSKKTIAVSETA